MAKRKHERFEVDDATFGGPTAREDARMFRLARPLAETLEQSIPYLEQLMRQLEAGDGPAHVAKRLRATWMAARHLVNASKRGRWVKFDRRLFHVW